MESITAISTPAGVGGIAVIRLSGKDALEIADRVWKGKRLSEVDSHTAHLGEILDAEGEMIDSAVATVFREGRSFTGENTVEFSVHGSKWIQREVIARLIQEGARAADRGEFTQRAFLNGRLDLAQAEAVADLIASESKAAHRIAASQIKGQFSRRLNAIRDDMIKLASLLELELDFSEEEVEFADRKQLLDLTESTLSQIRRLSSTFRTGKALKEGVPTVIAGIPNAGKSTLLNHLIGDVKAIVSDIPGTTRDTIEDTAEINGVLYRFIDTAGLRDSDDTIERIGIERAHAQLGKARIILWLIDPTSPLEPQLSLIQETLLPQLSLLQDTPLSQCEGSSIAHTLSSSSNAEESPTRSSSDPILIPVITKSDIVTEITLPQLPVQAMSPIVISAKTGEGITRLEQALTEASGGDTDGETLLITNLRHYESLERTAAALERVKTSLTEGISGDFIAQDLREAIHHLGAITGAITTDTLLHSIFSTFCIGK